MADFLGYGLAAAICLPFALFLLKDWFGNRQNFIKDVRNAHGSEFRKFFLKSRKRAVADQLTELKLAFAILLPLLLLVVLGSIFASLFAALLGQTG
ncbi:hypothetical protein HPT27_11225 [Permianibacter sp. IMCC34836]|uniref:hypothetical protein n=1 Tax=Permianibacter fluminis TaxID=2738515 RepID=UPI00155803B5|nr:hypothetical protein [Permianibacter fluminis]NQD37598.1 hypothetical protein [Permianibacter fluminis]